MLGAAIEEDVAELGAHDADARVAVRPVHDRAIDVAIVVDGLDERVAEADLAQASVDAQRLVERADRVGWMLSVSKACVNARANVIEPPCSLDRARVSTTVLRMP